EAAHQTLNRIVFLYFVQEKREWFDTKTGETLVSFLVREYKEFREKNSNDKKNFFDFLKALFFSAFNNKKGEIHTKYSFLPESLKELLLNAPYLNGGLFEENELDELGFEIPDQFFLEEDLIRGKLGLIPFLNSYNFTIVEDLENDKYLAVNPEFIGTIYEKLVHLDSSELLKSFEDKIDSEGVLKGIVYTKEPEIRFMVSRSLIQYFKNNTNLDEETIYDFVLKEEFEPEDKKTKEILKTALDNLKVVDPACGSGAFLVAMVDAIYRLYEKLREVENGYELRKKIIENNVYGVDVMEWAVKIAELRLWLFLIVEAELKKEEVMVKPLLPNLSFKVRVGDSLIEEVGGIDFSLLRSRRKWLKSSISQEVKRKIASLKKKKFAFAESKKDAPKKWEIEKEEVELFNMIVEEKIDKIKKKLRELGTLKSQRDLFGNEDKKKLSLFEKEEKKLLRDLEIYENLKKSLKKGKRPFIWDIDFVEVFYGEKKGFDIVIGNPPYVRQEKIAPPDKKEEDFKPSEWRKLKKEYKEKLQNMVVNLYGKEYKPDGKADLYVYFYFKALSLLNERGTLAFITSNSWLDVGFGKSLQEFLLKKTKIYSINDNQAKRSFKEADVNTVIVFTSSPNDNESENLENVAKFVMWKVPFEEVVNFKDFKDLLLFIDDLECKVENKDLTELSENVVSLNAFRVFPIKQKDLLRDGTKDGKYEGNKWGGKFLRAPDIFFTILKKGKGKLVKLGDIAEVKRGFTTGANEFFYVEDLTDKLSDSELEKVENLRGFTSVEKIKKAGLRIVKPSKWGKNAKDYKLFLIEKEFLKPVIKSPRELKTIVVREEDLKYRVFMCNKTRKELSGTFALDYIKWGEEQGFHKRPTCKSRREWYSLGERRISDFVVSAKVGERFACWKNGKFLADKILYDVFIGKDIDKEKTLVALNSLVFRLLVEMFSRQLTGAQAISDIDVIVYKESFLIDPNILGKTLEMDDYQKVLSIFTELGFDPNKPIREQEPNPLPDRKALDDIVFDALGLTEEERKEVYYAVAELVQNRLKKARSV
ncbi:MAG: DNA methyltransferase, partial [Desulfurobacteriaceae bacterium]